MAQKLEFTNNFLKSLEMLSEAWFLYDRKSYQEVFYFLEERLSDIPLDSCIILSEYYDLVASTLWKTNKYDEALLSWGKACEYNRKNRHSALCLNIFSGNSTSDPFLVFLRLKLNEFFALSGLSAADECCGEYSEIIDFIADFWDAHLKNGNYDNYSEPELAEIFLDIELFEM